MLIIQLMNIAAIGLASFVLALPATFSRLKNFWWVLLIAAVAVLDSFATRFGTIPNHMLGLHWNFCGKVASIVVALLIVRHLVKTGRLTTQEFGLTWRQAPGTGLALVTVVLPYVLAIAAYNMLGHGPFKMPSTEKLIFQATMPGLAEELVYRGMLLALFDRIFTARFKLLGAEMGYGAIVTSLIFGALHGVTLGPHWALHLSITRIAFTGSVGFCLAWMRARSQSLVLPVVMHNVTNLIANLVPKVL